MVGGRDDVDSDDHEDIDDEAQSHRSVLSM